jgi:hypothetical protein
MSGLDQKGTKFPGGVNVDAGELFIADVAVTSTAAELNKLDGVTAVTADINALAGIASRKFIPGEKFIVQTPIIAAADVAKPFWVAPAACTVLSASEAHTAACDAADTLQITKLVDGEAPAAPGEDALLATPFTLNSTINTTVTQAAVTTAAATLAAGDRLCTKYVSGDGTSYAGGTITVVLAWN